MIDQEAATALLAKYSSLKAETEDHLEVMKSLDRMLFRLMHQCS
jgi:hypothetical protein